MDAEEKARRAARRSGGALSPFAVFVDKSMNRSIDLSVNA